MYFFKARCDLAAVSDAASRISSPLDLLTVWGLGRAWRASAVLTTPM